jgi:hypothetical protein
MRPTFVPHSTFARIADALGFEIPSEELLSRTAKLLVIFGYKRLSGFWTSGAHNGSADLMFTIRSATSRQPKFDPYDRKVQRLRNAVLTGPGSLPPGVRQALSEGLDQSGVLGAYAKKVAEHAHLITNDDIAALHLAHYSDDQIFEATVSAALGAGLLRMECVLRALRSEQPAAIVAAGPSIEEACAPLTQDVVLG